MKLFTQDHTSQKMAQRKFTLGVFVQSVLFPLYYIAQRIEMGLCQHLKIKLSGKFGGKGEDGIPGTEKPSSLKHLGKALFNFLINSSIIPSFLASVLFKNLKYSHWDQKEPKHELSRHPTEVLS